MCRIYGVHFNATQGLEQERCQITANNVQWIASRVSSMISSIVDVHKRRLHLQASSAWKTREVHMKYPYRKIVWQEWRWKQQYLGPRMIRSRKSLLWLYDCFDFLLTYTTKNKHTNARYPRNVSPTGTVKIFCPHPSVILDLPEDTKLSDKWSHLLRLLHMQSNVVTRLDNWIAQFEKGSSARMRGHYQCFKTCSRRAW